MMRQWPCAYVRTPSSRTQRSLCFYDMLHAALVDLASQHVVLGREYSAPHEGVIVG